MKNNGFLRVQAAQAAKAAQEAGRPQEIKKKSAVQNTVIFMLQVFIGMHFLAQISQMGFQRAPSGGFGSFQEASQDTPGSIGAPSRLQFLGKMHARCPRSCIFLGKMQAGGQLLKDVCGEMAVPEPPQGSRTRKTMKNHCFLMVQAAQAAKAPPPWRAQSRYFFLGNLLGCLNKNINSYIFF